MSPVVPVLLPSASQLPQRSSEPLVWGDISELVTVRHFLIYPTKQRLVFEVFIIVVVCLFLFLQKMILRLAYPYLGNFSSL